MFSMRYGDLTAIAAHTDGDCHLCHEPADLDFYGPTGSFGDDTVTVDHLKTQRDGGSDRAANLRIAHGTCNSIRGTRSVKTARMELAGTADAPMSAGEKTTWSVVGGAGAAILAGYAFAKPTPQGPKEFNTEAALFAGLLTLLFVRVAL